MIRSERSHLNVAALNDPGAKGKNNEDRYAVSSYLLGAEDSTPVVFAVVADGIGGHRAGEVAAEMAVDYISEAVAKSNARRPIKIMEMAIQGASNAIASRADGNEDREGMGATCACVWIFGDRLYISYVGDSRIYLLRGDKIQQLTIDHTWVQEAIEKGILDPEMARDHPNVHVIRRHLGSQQVPEVDTRLCLRNDENALQAEANQGAVLRPGDILLICTDGLTDLVLDDEIFGLIKKSDVLEKAAKRLVDKANERGGHDNITVVLLEVPGGEPRKTKAGFFSKFSFSGYWLAGFISVVLVLLGLISAMVWSLTRVNPQPTQITRPTVTLVIPGSITPTP
ncbi:MAG: serine/threonine-protein phosphatase [Anaerolineales bacterium]|nr:serine/threonine-protein phosphatase [Anaerolineales bacterium]